MDRREWLQSTAGLVSASLGLPLLKAATRKETPSPLTIKALKVTPIALPDPPLLAASGCHGPYFLRNVVELETDAGIVGVGETHGGESVTKAIEESREHVVGENAFAYGGFAAAVTRLSRSAWAGVELACLDAIGQAVGRPLCELLGGPVRKRTEFASYLFFRYAPDHPKLLADSRVVDSRGRGDRALDDWGEVRTPESMAEMAWKFHKRWGFRKHKLKAGVLPPDVELEALQAIDAKFEGEHPLRIDPNGRWKLETALRIGKRLKDLPLEYYEDPVPGQEAMAEVREKTGLKMSTNSCVTSFDHIPGAIRTRPIDIVLCDHHYWGGIPACQALGRIADTLGWSLSQHSNNHAGISMAAMVHVGALIPQLTYASDTHYPWLVEGADIIEGPNIKIENGEIAVPTRPGVGVKIDRDKLSRARETYEKCGMRRRNDSYTMQMVEPGWERTLY